MVELTTNGFGSFTVAEVDAVQPLASVMIRL